MVDVQRRLERVSDATEAAWQDAMMLRECRRLWDSIAPHLDGYEGDGLWLRWWYRDWLLAGCRRLLDISRDTTSLVRALVLLQPVAKDLTPEAVLRRWQIAGTEGVSDETTTRRVLDDLTGGEPLTSAFVDAEVQRLRERHAEAVAMANEHVAHRSLVTTVDSLDIDQVVALEDDVLDVVYKWHRIVNGSHLTTQQPLDDLPGPVATALRLFDWGDYHRAIEDADLALGPWRDEYSKVVGIEYIVEKPDD